MRPTRRCCLLFTVTLPVSLLPVLAGDVFVLPWILLLGGLLLVTGLDLVLGLPRRRLDVTVVVPPQLYVAETGVVQVAIRARTRRTGAQVELLLDLRGDVQPVPPVAPSLAPNVPRSVDLALTPLRRGMVVVERVWLRWTGPFGLVARKLVKEVDAEVAVVPSIAAVRRAALRFARDRDAYSSQRSVRYVSEGSEFEAMREYVPGLDPRTVNWKASARHRKLVCEEHRAERNHQVIVAFDTGHLMAEPLDGIPKLDHAIHTGLALAHTCLRRGDRVGLYAFDEKVRAFAEPHGGTPVFARLQRQTADLAYTTAETNFTLGIAELSSRLHRRSLVVILTDFVDTVTARLMVENAGRLARRHLLVFVSLHDEDVALTVDRTPRRLDDLHRAVVAAEFIRERRLVMRRLERFGIFAIDAPPRSVSTDLLNRYLEIKRRELL